MLDFRGNSYRSLFKSYYVCHVNKRHAFKIRFNVWKLTINYTKVEMLIKCFKYRQMLII